MNNTALYLVLVVMLFIFIPISSVTKKSLDEDKKLPLGFKAFIIFFTVLTYILAGWKYIFLPILVIPILALIVSIPLDNITQKRNKKIVPRNEEEKARFEMIEKDVEKMFYPKGRK